LPEGYALRWFREDDLDAYVSGLNETLYDRYDEARFRWKHWENPHGLGFPSIVVAEDLSSGEPVGFNAFIPLEIRSCGEKFLAVQGCDGFVAREHRRRGIFLETIGFMKRELASRGPQILIGFNFAGSTAAAVKAGSVAVCDVNHWELDPEILLIMASDGKKSLELVECDTEEASETYESWVSTSELIHVHRSLDYLRWRYDDSPLKDYEFYIVRKGSEKLGYVALSEALDDEGDTVIGVDDVIMGSVDPSDILWMASELSRLHEDAVKIELLARAGSDLDSSIKALGIDPDPRYTMIMDGISGIEAQESGLFRRGTEISRPEGWHIMTSDIY